MNIDTPSFAQSMQFLYCLITVVLYVKINFDIKETFFNRLVLYHNSPLYGQLLQKWREKRSMCLCLDAVNIRLSEVITLLIVSYSKISGANFHIQYVDSPCNFEIVFRCFSIWKQWTFPFYKTGFDQCSKDQEK